VFNLGGNRSGPGLVLLIPCVDKLVKVNLQTVTTDVPPQDVITHGNVSSR
jgi:regulator of protease activity HflC (stomatin/prohibitin superfamily)